MSKRTVALVAVVGVAFVVGVIVGAAKPYVRVAAPLCEAHTEDLTYRGDLVMVVAVGMNGTAVIVDVKMAAMDPDIIREVAFSHDTATVVGLQGLPRSRGVYECILEEWSNSVRREFRVRDYWSVGV